MERIIAHSDLNSFYASVECLYHPELRGKPVSVCGSVEERHGIVLASTPEAKKLGVKTGEAVWQAKQKCPSLVIVAPHMDRYVRFSQMTREIYSSYSPCVEPFGLDESWIDLTGCGTFDDGVKIADEIRHRVRKELGVTVSIGVSFNKSAAKIGSDLKKPNFTNPIPKEMFKEIVWPLPADSLWGVGRATKKRLDSYCISTIEKLAQTNPDTLKRMFGVHGINLWRLANGIDNEPVSVTGTQRIIKSIGNSTTTPRNLESDDDVRLTAMLLAESVAERLRDKKFKCQVVQVSIRSEDLSVYQRQAPLPFPSCTAHRIGDLAIKLILANWDKTPIRSLGVRGCNLIEDSFPQLSLLPEIEHEQKQEDLERTVQDLRRRFGHFVIQRGSMVADRKLSSLEIRDNASAQSIAFFRQ